jgi:hypothetical protein
MQSYRDSYLYVNNRGHSKPINTYETFHNTKDYWCSFQETPKHFDIYPSSNEILSQLCEENNLFVEEFIKLENIFLLQEKMYFCDKIRQQHAIQDMIEIHNKMSSLFDQKYLSHHQAHLDAVKGIRTDMPINKMDKDKLCASL